MLTIKNLDGTDLVSNPPADATYRALNEGQSVAVTVSARIIEDDPYLAGMFVNGTLDWNDGTLPTAYAATAGTLTVSASKGLLNGDYLVSLYGSNYRAPVPDQVRVNFPISVVQESAKAEPLHIIYGPILPRDVGFPNPSQWMYNTESDLLILESSVRMLMLTNKGERLMEPDYGTNVRRILFEQNVKGIESAVQEEIISAITTWEPRVTLQNIAVQRTNDKSVNVAATFLSKLSAQPFDLNLQYVR